MKKKIIVFIFIILILILSFLYSRNNLIFISEENKKELISVLEIEDAPSFKPISKKSVYLGTGSSPKCYELKFLISIEDYEKNNLNYKDKDTTELDIHYKIKKNDNTYICTVRTSNQNEYTTQLYTKILNALK